MVWGNLDTGEEKLGGVMDFPGFAPLDPEREFAEKQLTAEAQRADLLHGQRMSESDLLRQVLSQGGDYLFRQAFNRGVAPGVGFTSMEDVLREAIAPGGDAVIGGAGGTGVIADFLAELPSGAGFAANVGGVNPAQRTGIAERSRRRLGEGPVREVLGGEGFVSKSGAAFRTPTPQMLIGLTDEGRAAAGTGALAELNTPLADIAQESAAGFFAPTRRTRERAVRR
jgi:hypothetical protein